MAVKTRFRLSNSFVVTAARPKVRQTAAKTKGAAASESSPPSFSPSLPLAQMIVPYDPPPGQTGPPAQTPRPLCLATQRPLRPSKSPMTLYNPGACRPRPAAPRF